MNMTEYQKRIELKEKERVEKQTPIEIIGSCGRHS